MISIIYFRFFYAKIYFIKLSYIGIVIVIHTFKGINLLGFFSSYFVNRLSEPLKEQNCDNLINMCQMENSRVSLILFVVLNLKIVANNILL